MKLLVILTARGYLMDPRMTKELAIKALKSKRLRFKDSELTFVRLPNDLYEATFNIETGDKQFSWTTDAINGKLAKLMESVDGIVTTYDKYPWYDDNVIYEAQHESHVPVYVYNRKIKDFDRMWA